MVVEPRRRRSVEIRREEILASTTELLDEIGLAAMRVSDVAGALGISSALVHYHFGTKDDLVIEAFGYAVERDLKVLDRATAQGATPVDKLRRALRSYGPTGQATGWRIWIDAWALAQREPGIRAVLRDLEKRWCAVLESIVVAGVEEGAFVCDDPRVSVAKVSALLDGLSTATLVYRTVTRAELRQWVAQTMAQELGIDVAELA